MTITPNRVRAFSHREHEYHQEGAHRPHRSEHTVQFYETDEFLVRSLGRFIREGLETGESCIVVATGAHHQRVETYLLAQGVDLHPASKQGAYLALDAEETLSAFMVAGSPDPARFTSIIGDIIERAAARGHPVRVFGEMVALLWMDGNQAAAIELERLWNDLRDNPYPFALFCAYAMGGFVGNKYSAAFAEICRQHSSVIPDENYTTLGSEEERQRAVTLLQQKASSIEKEVAERKAVEDQLRVALAAQRQLEERKNAFISMASHELKTPITSLKGFTQVLRQRLQTQADPQTLLFLDRMDVQLKKLTNLISDLLDISKMQTGMLAFRETIFDLDELVRETVENVQAAITTHHIRLRGETQAQIAGDRDRLGQVLINLLTNAIKYSPRAETVIVRLRSYDGQAEVSVQDFGIGIDREQCERIFEQFYQVADPVHTYPGLGIGLYIAHTIIERHGGRLWVESEKGAGSTFYCTLPLLKNGSVASSSCEQRESHNATRREKMKRENRADE